MLNTPSSVLLFLPLMPSTPNSINNQDIFREVTKKWLFLDALASLGSMLESGSVIHVFEILSNIGHIFRVGSE